MNHFNSQDKNLTAYIVIGVGTMVVCGVVAAIKAIFHL